jgi:hypothetical protein
MVERLSYRHYKSLHFAAGYGEGELADIVMWMDTPDQLKLAEIEMLEERLREIRDEVSDIPTSMVTPW